MFKHLGISIWKNFAQFLVPSKNVRLPEVICKSCNNIVRCRCIVILQVMNTLGARDFSSMVSSFCQVFTVTHLQPKMCRPSANTENSHRTREKPLVPSVRDEPKMPLLSINNNNDYICCGNSLFFYACFGAFSSVFDASKGFTKIKKMNKESFSYQRLCT